MDSKITEFIKIIFDYEGKIEDKDLNGHIDISIKAIQDILNVFEEKKGGKYSIFIDRSEYDSLYSQIKVYKDLGEEDKKYFILITEVDIEDIYTYKKTFVEVMEEVIYGLENQNELIKTIEEYIINNPIDLEQEKGLSPEETENYIFSGVLDCIEENFGNKELGLGTILNKSLEVIKDTDINCKSSFSIKPDNEEKVFLFEIELEENNTISNIILLKTKELESKSSIEAISEIEAILNLVVKKYNYLNKR